MENQEEKQFLMTERELSSAIFQAVGRAIFITICEPFKDETEGTAMVANAIDEVVQIVMKGKDL